MSPEQTYFAFLAIGILLVLLEIFIPGGVLGIVGLGLLLVATVQGFSLFGPVWGAVGLFASLVVLVLGAVGWIRIFPQTWFGRKMILDAEIDEEDEEDDLVGEHGVALTDLQPSGLARIQGRRMDVIARTGWIPRDSHVEVVGRDGFQIYVDPVTTDEPASGTSLPEEAPA